MGAPDTLSHEVEVPVRWSEGTSVAMGGRDELGPGAYREFERTRRRLIPGVW